MAFTGRSLDEIRDQLLGEWAYQYSRVGQSLLTVEGSDAWMAAGAVALTLMAQEREAEVLQDQILPDKATTAFLDRHGIVDGTPRKSAVASTLTISLTGVPGASSAPGGLGLVSSTGVRFNILSAVVPLAGALDGGGNGFLVIQCATPGTDGNLALGAVLTWVSAPAGFNPTGLVTALTVPGEAAELDAPYAARIISRRQNRPAAGNRQDWRQWALDVDGVDDAYVYPLLYSSNTGTLGAVTLVCLGPLPGESAVQTRIVSGPGPGTVISRVNGYIEGTNDVHGTAVALADQVQLRPVTMPWGSYVTLAATPINVPVTLGITVAGVNAFPFLDFGGHYTVQAAPAPTVSSFTVGPAPDTRVAAEQLVAGDTIAVQSGTQRGLWSLTTAVTVNPVTGAVTVSPALDMAPFAGVIILPATPLWAAIRTAIYAVFDALGPQDTDVAPAYPLVACRWPAPSVQARAKLYVSQLQAAALSVPGVINATVTLPAADLNPQALRLLMLSELILTP